MAAAWRRTTKRLPRAEGAQPPRAGSGDAVAMTPKLPSLRLLVVDDNIDAAQSLCLLLEALGHETVVEHDAVGAIARAREQRPQMLFLDIGLPDMDGFELARRLRATAETADAVFVAVTGYGREGDRELAMQAGFDHHMTKPVKLSALLDLLHRYAPRRQSV